MHEETDRSERELKRTAETDRVAASIERALSTPTPPAKPSGPPVKELALERR